MIRFDVRKDVPVCAAAVVAALLFGLLCFYAARGALDVGALAGIQAKSLELASLSAKGEDVRAQTEELASEIELLGGQVRDSSRTGVWVGLVTGVGFLAVSLVAHFLVLARREAGEPSRAGEEPGGKES